MLSLLMVLGNYQIVMQQKLYSVFKDCLLKEIKVKDVLYQLEAYRHIGHLQQLMETEFLLQKKRLLHVLQHLIFFLQN